MDTHKGCPYEIRDTDKRCFYEIRDIHMDVPTTLIRGLMLCEQSGDSAGVPEENRLFGVETFGAYPAEESGEGFAGVDGVEEDPFHLGQEAYRFLALFCR